MKDQQVRNATALKTIYVYGVELIECECGVWRVNDSQVPCWSHQDRAQMLVEAVAQLNQATRNLAHEIARAWRLSR